MKKSNKGPGGLFQHLLRILLMEAMACRQNGDSPGLALVERLVEEIHKRFCGDE